MRPALGQDTARAAMLPPTSPPAGPEALRTLVPPLRKLLREFDLAAADGLEDDRALLRSLLGEDDFAAFERHIQGYAFTDAYALLERRGGDRLPHLTSGSMNERILVVDDAPANIQTVAAIVKGQGYQVTVATNGNQALDVVERIRPDLILLDVMMPELDGFETCRRIKRVEAWRAIPIIFLTAKTDTLDLVKGFEIGAVDYVGKPFNAHELLARVGTHLTIDQLRRSLAVKNAELARAHELVRRAFGRYVSEEVAESLLRAPEALELGGEEREATILMSDLRGFTAMAERMPPRGVIEVLNLYLERMVDVIGRYEGTIDEIIGDAILVIFGAPVASDDHASKAVACGLAMQLAIRTSTSG
jgi:adenylate cyclase